MEKTSYISETISFGIVYGNLKDLLFALRLFCDEHIIDETHGFNHAIAVGENAYKAIECWNECLDINIQLMIMVASLLHDVDDRKYFPNNKNYENAKRLLNIHCNKIFSDDNIRIIVRMIDLVSASKNKDAIPKDITLWMLIPRYADRLEAIGVIGLKRNLQYTLDKHMPLYLDTTERLQTIEELNLVITNERYENYNGISDSMLGHIYDKLLHIGKFPIRNNYFDNECKKRSELFINFVLKFGKGEIRNVHDIENFIEIESLHN